MILDFLESLNLRRYDSISVNFWSSEGETRFPYISEAQKVRLAVLEFQELKRWDSLAWILKAQTKWFDLLKFLKFRRWDTLSLNFRSLEGVTRFFWISRLRKKNSIWLNFWTWRVKVWLGFPEFLKFRRWNLLPLNFKS